MAPRGVAGGPGHLADGAGVIGPRRPAATARFAAVPAVMVAIALTSCSSSAVSAPSVPEVFDLHRDPAASVAPVDPDRGVVAPADQLRLLLEHHLSWHGITLVHAMQSAERNDSGTTPWIDALVANTDDLTGAIGLVYGPAGARAFQQQWAQHTQFLIDYASAVGRGDAAAADEARARLHDYVTDAGSFLATATGGHLPVDTARAVLANHVEHMMNQLDAAARSDQAGALSIASEDHGYLFGIADALAGAIGGQQPVAFPGSTDTPFANYCSLANRGAGDLLLERLADPSAASADGAPRVARDELDAAEVSSAQAAPH